MNGKIYFGDTLVSNPIIEGSSLDITTNGTHDVGSYEEAVVNVTAGAEVEMKDVNFYDYDGKILYSYSASAFANLTSLPANPSHVGLTAQGWNYTLAAAKTYVNTYGKLNIGQSYVTDDGKTRIYVNIPEEISNPNITLRMTKSGSGTVTIDWGDGNTSTFSGTSALHSYNTTGVMMITVSCTGTATIGLGNRSSYELVTFGGTSTSYDDRYGVLRKVEIGSNCTEIDAYCFNKSTKLEYVTIPTNVSYIGSNFIGCNSLKVLIAPAGLIKFGQDSGGVGESGRGAFSCCISLETVILPEGMTYCNILQRGTGNMSSFYCCYSLKSLTLPSDYWDAVPDYSFYNCTSLKYVIISNSHQSIGSYMFWNCNSLEYFLMPSNIVTIGSLCVNCQGLVAIKMQSAYPPTLSGNLVNNSIPGNDYWVIYVPSGSKSRYTSATNWSSISASKYIEY